MEGPLCFLDEGIVTHSPAAAGTGTGTGTATADAGTVADTMERDHIV
jgi:hypothetical protein